MKPIFLLRIALCGFLFSGFAQDRAAGPVIKEFGKVSKIENPDFKTDTSLAFKAVFDIMKTPDNQGELNRSIETAARFLNMHAQAGVPPENLKVALILHNLATKDLISNEAYQKRYGMNNPNAELISALQAAGGQVIVCGQSIHSRGFSKEELLPNVQVALSAMTALIQLQKNDYNLIKF